MLTEPFGGLLATGFVIGERYRIEHHVASGGFGNVYSALHLVLESRVAIKVLKIERLVASDASKHIGAFLDEARLLARLRHPNIVPVHDAGVVVETTQPWIALDWCDGKTLRDLVDVDPRPRTVQEAWALLRPVAHALEYAHGQGVIHRDVKPSNVMLVAEGASTIPKLVDFGIAKLVGNEIITADATQSRGVSLGFSPAYAAPEQVTGSPTGRWTDVHALMLLFVELVNGEPAYERSCPLESAMATERPALRSLASRNPALDEIVARALSRDPRVRHTSVAELADALDRLFPDTIQSLHSTTSQPPAQVIIQSPRATTQSTGLVRHAAASLETSPTSGAISRDALSAFPAKKQSRLRGALIAIASVAIVTALAVVGVMQMRKRFNHSVIAAATTLPIDSPPHEIAPASSVVSNPHVPIPTPGPKGTVHHDRRVAKLGLDVLLARTQAASYSVVSSSKTDTAAGMVLTISAQRGSCFATVMYMLESKAEYAEIIAWQSESSLPDGFYAVEDNAVLSVNIAMIGGIPNDPACRDDLAKQLAPAM